MLCLHLTAIQFQIWSSFKYLTIPGTAFAAFLLLGFLEIGQEMYVSLLCLRKLISLTTVSENPFNYDLNDLGQFILLNAATFPYLILSRS